MNRPPIICLHCGAGLNRHLNIGEIDDKGATEGLDYVICAYCNAVNILTHNNVLRRPTAKENRDIAEYFLKKLGLN